MRPHWLQAATDAIRRNDPRKTLAGAVAGLGAALAIGGMEWLSVASHHPLVIIPFATSIVLVIGSPEAEPAQPRVRCWRVGQGHRGIMLGVLGSIPQRKPVAVAVKLHIALMEGFKRRAMADRDDGGCRQFLLDQAIQYRLRGFIERGGGFIEEQI